MDRVPAAATRRDFLKTAALASLAPVFGACAAAPESGTAAAPAPERAPTPAPAPAPAPDALDRSYLRRGLRAMAAAPPEASLGAHGGAAVIATWFFARENALDEPAQRALRERLDAFIALQPAAFPEDRPAGGAPAHPDRIAETLEESIALLRANGHDAIFGAVALQALRAEPELAVAPVVDGLCALLRNFTAQFPAQDPGPLREHPPEPYRDDQDLLARSFAAMAQVRREVAAGARRSGAEPLHWYTHTDAVLTLAELGYAGTARLGHASLLQHLHGPPPAPAPAPHPEPAPAPWLAARYWDSPEAREPLGFWSAGHVFKFPFSLYRLARRTADPDRARAAISDSVWMLRDPRLLVPRLKGRVADQ